MNESESQAPVSPSPANSNSEVESLQRQIALLYAAVLVVSCTFCAFLGLQTRRAKAELKNLKPVAVQVIQTAEKDRPRWNEFIKRAADYGKTHPDFDPIMKKYKLADVAAVLSSNAQPAQATAPK